MKRGTRKQFKDFLSLGRMIYLLSLVFLHWWPALHVLYVCVCGCGCMCVCRCALWWFNCCLSEATFRDVLLATCNCANKFTWHRTVRLTWETERVREREREGGRHGGWPIPSGNWYSIIERLMKLFGLQHHHNPDLTTIRPTTDCRRLQDKWLEVSFALSYSLSLSRFVSLLGEGRLKVIAVRGGAYNE